MNSKRLYYVLLGSVGLLIIGLVGGAYGATVLLQNESKTLLDARAKTQALDSEQASLAKAKNDIKKYQDLGKIAKSVVPQDKDQAETVREIVKIANSAGIKLGAINFPSSTLGAKAAGAAAASSTSSSTTATAAPTAAGSQLKTVPGITGVYDLAIIVQSDTTSSVPYAKFLNFLAGLENNRRTALVSGINLTPDTKAPDRVTFTLNIDEYIKP